MKRTVSLILTLVMVLSMLTVFASAAVPNYETAKNGDVLYEANFSGTDGIYAPVAFRYSAAASAANPVEVSNDGKSITATCSTKGAWFYGGKFEGLKLGADKQYTITFKATFPSGNVGFYFNAGNYDTSKVAPTSEISYTGLYGIYGKLKGTSLTLSRGAGGKISGDLVSTSAAYTAPTNEVENDTEVDVRFEIDGYFYSVFFNDVLYDHVDMTDKAKCAYIPNENLGFIIYLYNAKAKTTVSNLTVKKGCTYTKAAAEAANPGKTYVATAVDYGTTTVDYAAVQDGAKITDLLFNATSGAFVPKFISKTDYNTYVISEDGKSYSSTIGATKGANWYGGTIGNLKITDNTKYTFKFKQKQTAYDAMYASAVAFCCDDPETMYRLNWYGTMNPTDATYTINDQAVKTNVKYAYNGTNLPGYGYSDATMAAFITMTPKIDADGFIDVAVELDGWTWTYYVMGEDGKYAKVQTIDNKELLKLHFGVDLEGMNNLCFQVYTYNVGISATVKDAELYKGTTVSVDYSAAAVTDPVVTGDAVTNYALIAALSLLAVLGMGWVCRKAN